MFFTWNKTLTLNSLVNNINKATGKMVFNYT